MFQAFLQQNFFIAAIIGSQREQKKFFVEYQSEIRKRKRFFREKCAFKAAFAW